MGGSLKKCVQCGKDNSARCSGCFVAHYCSADCQKLGWKKHKAECKETRAKYKVATFGQDNKERSLKGHLGRVKGQEELYDALEKEVRKNGFKGQKGFFPAICKRDPAEVNGYKLEINPEKMFAR